MSHLDSQRQPCYYASSNAGSGNDKAAARNQQMSNKNETILKLVAELKASAIDGLSIDISEKPDGSVSVVFHQSSEEIDLDPPTEINCFGSKYWKDKDGLLHRDGDLPAAIYADGSKYYYKNGNCHRDGDLPAVIFKNKYEYWLDGKHILTVKHKDGIVEI